MKFRNGAFTLKGPYDGQEEGVRREEDRPGQSFKMRRGYSENLRSLGKRGRKIWRSTAEPAGETLPYCHRSVLKRNQSKYPTRHLVFVPCEAQTYVTV
jgi:hypothetical protein